MKVSVIIPAYNEEKYIGTCLKHLVEQEQKADEIIVVDNNSTDSTAEIVKKFAEVTLIREPTQGMIPARNAGFNYANGDLIARCDSDCQPPSDWIKKIKENFTSKQIDGLSGPVIFYDMSPTTPFFANLFADWVANQEGFDPMFGPNMILTKQIWEKIKNNVCLNDKDVHEDLDLAYHVNQAGGKIFFDKKLVSSSSARRIKGNFLSFFFEYPIRLRKTLNRHKKLLT